MLGRPQYQVYDKGIKLALDQAVTKQLQVIGAKIERKAKLSMRVGGGEKREPSEPGTPPHVQTGTLRSSIGYAVIMKVTGPALLVGWGTKAWYGAIHEYGSKIHPERPFIKPAADSVLGNLQSAFSGFNLANTKAGRSLNSRDPIKELSSGLPVLHPKISAHGSILSKLKALLLGKI